MGKLRTSLYYPAPAAYGNHAAGILAQCNLNHLIKRLDEEDSWTSILSLGEQQRLAIGLAIIRRAKVIFLDEAKSVMDEGLEYAMYRLVKKSLPQAILISVGHRSSLLDLLHSWRLSYGLSLISPAWQAVQANLL